MESEPKTSPPPHNYDAPPSCLDVAIAIVFGRIAPQHQLLICQRQAQRIWGGYWEFPGGKVEPGETPDACVVREVQEEVGLTIHVLQALPSIEHAYPQARIRLHPFVCEHLHGQAQPLQVQECRWVNIQELGQYRFPPANDPLLRYLSGKA